MIEEHRGRARLDDRAAVGEQHLVGELAGEGMTCILVTHEMRFARELADEVLFTAGGTIVESGPPSALFDHTQKERTRAFLSQIL